MKKLDYDKDYFLWSQQQSQLLKEGKLHLIDAKNIAEEIESLGKSDKRRLESLLSRLLEHLLKRKHTGMQECYRGWDIEIRNFSEQIQRLLADSPSLKNYLQQISDRSYQKAIDSVTQDYDIYDFSGGLDLEAVMNELLEK